MDTKEKDRLQEQRQRVKAAREAEKKALAGSKTVRVEFHSMEPGADGTRPDLAFSYRGIKNYHLVHGQQYDLPECVVDWLESRQVPVYKQYDPAEVQAGLRAEPIDANARISGYAPRFMLRRMVASNIRVSDGSAPETKQRKAA